MVPDRCRVCQGLGIYYKPVISGFSGLEHLELVDCSYCEGGLKW